MFNATAALRASKDVISRFAFHTPDQEGREEMKSIRIKVRELARTIQLVCPESREKATALTNLATVMMNANSAIVQQYPIDTSDLTLEEREICETEI